MATKKCTLCNEKIQEEHGKLKGTIIKVKDEKNKTQFIPVCSTCQKQPDHIDNAKIKSA